MHYLPQEPRFSICQLGDFLKLDYQGQEEPTCTEACGSEAVRAGGGGGPVVSRVLIPPAPPPHKHTDGSVPEIEPRRMLLLMHL